MPHDAPLPPADAGVAADAAAPIAGARPARQAALIFIFITVTIDTIAMGIMAPVLPTLIERLTGGVQQAGWMNGLFMTVFAVMQFLFSPVLGALSDRFGRRPILLLSIAGLGLSYAAMGMATSVWQLLVIRLFTGATSANIATAFAYIADVTPTDRRAGAYGLMQAGMSMGFAIGPGVAGLLVGIDPTFPFWAAAALSLVNAVYGFFVVPESLPKARRATLQLGKLGYFRAVSILTSKPGLLRMSLVLALAQFATMVFPTVFVLYAEHRYSWTIATVSLCLTAFGLCSAAVQAGVSGRMVRAFGESKVIRIGLLCGVAGTAVFGLAPIGVLFMVGIPIMTLSGICGPAIQSLMTRQVAPSEQGRLQGANTSLQAIAGIVAPMLFSGVFYFTVGGWHGINTMGAAFLLASATLATAAIMATQGSARLQGAMIGSQN